MHCQDCGHTWTGPGYDQDTLPTSGCPNCGSFRTQVSPTHSEMEIRDMPTNGMDDMGGNPLQEGVWANIDGGWQNRMKRDESFASVGKKIAAIQVIPHQGYGVHLDVKEALEQINAAITSKGLPPFTLNGIPAPEGIAQIPTFSKDPVDIDHPAKKVLGIVKEVIESGVGTGWKEKMMQKQKPAPNPLEQPPMGGPQGGPPQQPGTFARTAEINWDDDDDDGDYDFSGQDLNPYQIPQVQEVFMVGPNGKMIRPDDRLIYAQGGNVGDVHHEDLAAHNGIRPTEMGEFPGYSLGQTMSDGTGKMLTVDPSHQPEQIQQIVGQHFPEHSFNLGSAATTNQERIRREFAEQQADPNESQHLRDWKALWQPESPQRPDYSVAERQDPRFEEKKRQEQEAVAQRGGKPFRYNENPFFNRGGSNRNKIYGLWSHDMSSVASDFEVEQVVPPGPHTEEVDYGDSTPLILQHDDPQLLDDAKQKLEARVAGPELLLPLVRAVGPSLLFGVMRGAMSSGGAGGGAPAPQQQPLPLESLSSIHNSLLGAFDGPFDNHPSSDANMAERASGDPDDVDPHEFNDGEDNLARDDIGGGADAFTPEVMSALEDAEPSLIHYFNSEESGADDPAIRKLVEALERDHPGLLDQEPDEQAMTALKNLKHGSNPGQMGVPGIGGIQAPTPAPGSQQLVDPVAQPQQQVNPMTQASCPHCGARLTAGQGVCPQCNGSVSLQPNTTVDPGMATQGIYPAGTPMTSQPGMGPFTAANQGPHNPEQFKAVKDYLIQQIQDPNDLATQLQDLIDHPENFGDILSQIQGKGQPPTPDPDPGAPPPMPPGGAMPPGAMPPGGAPPQGMPMQAASDPITPPCPNCDSHTTGMISDEGTAQCSNCNHKWKTDFEVQGEKTPVQPKAAAEDHQRSDAWIDASGAPLEVGRKYEMKTPKYDIPDEVTIESIKPEEIEYSLNGAYNLAHRTAISRDEAEMEGYSFEYVGPDENDILNEQGPNEQMEAPNMAPAYSTVKRADLYNNIGPIQPEEHAMQSINYPPSSQTQYATCPGCGALTKPTLGGCPHCNTPMAQPGVHPGGPVGDLNDWARNNVPEDPNRYTSGKKFTPMEQREFIDEPGVARNSEKLDLEGTHYTEQDGLSDDLFLFGL